MRSVDRSRQTGPSWTFRLALPEAAESVGIRIAWLPLPPLRHTLRAGRSPLRLAWAPLTGTLVVLLAVGAMALVSGSARVVPAAPASVARGGQATPTPDTRPAIQLGSIQVQVSLPRNLAPATPPAESQPGPATAESAPGAPAEPVSDAPGGPLPGTSTAAGEPGPDASAAAGETPPEADAAAASARSARSTQSAQSASPASPRPSPPQAPTFLGIPLPLLGRPQQAAPPAPVEDAPAPPETPAQPDTPAPPAAPAPPEPASPSDAPAPGPQPAVAEPSPAARWQDEAAQLGLPRPAPAPGSNLDDALHAASVAGQTLREGLRALPATPTPAVPAVPARALPATPALSATPTAPGRP